MAKSTGCPLEIFTNADCGACDIDKYQAASILPGFCKVSDELQMLQTCLSLILSLVK